MDVLAFILDGLEAALELERELGVRTVEIDRGLLAATELGWKAERGIDEMCADAWRWQSQNPYGFNPPPAK